MSRRAPAALVPGRARKYDVSHSSESHTSGYAEMPRPPLGHLIGISRQTEEPRACLRLAYLRGSGNPSIIQAQPLWGFAFLSAFLIT